MLHWEHAPPQHPFCYRANTVLIGSYPLLPELAGLACNLQKYLKSTGSCLLVNNRTKDKPEVKTVLDTGAQWVDSPAGEKTPLRQKDGTFMHRSLHASQLRKLSGELTAGISHTSEVSIPILRATDLLECVIRVCLEAYSYMGIAQAQQ